MVDCLFVCEHVACEDCDGLLELEVLAAVLGGREMLGLLLRTALSEVPADILVHVFDGVLNGGRNLHEGPTLRLEV